MAIEIVTLGNPSVRLDGEELERLPSMPIRFSLLVYVAVEGRVTADAAMAMFWAERPPDRARQSLTQTLHELRQDLRQVWFARSGSWVKVLESVDIDARSLIKAVDEERHADAVGLYGGPFLEGCVPSLSGFEPWAERYRGVLATLCRRAYRKRSDELLERGDLDVALDLAHRWIGMAGEDDEAHHFLIHALIENGNRKAALDHYERLRDMLAADGLEPIEQTRELVDRVRDGSLPHRPAERSSPASDREDGSSTPEPDRAREPGASRDSPAPAPDEQPRRVRPQLLEDMAPALRILEPLGTGSMSTVYKALQAPLKRPVAVKVLSPELSRSDNARARFALEAEAAARIDHAGVVPVYDVGRLDDGTPYLVYRYVNGTTLEERLRGSGPLDEATARHFVRDIASALAEAHRVGVIHRDVRPGNVMYEEARHRLLLMDFGVAAIRDERDDVVQRLTDTGQFVGSVPYTSPEQIDGELVGPRADLYSLGVLGCELLTGSVPGYVDGRILVPEIEDRVLREVLRACLDPEPRYRPSALDVAKQLAVGEEWEPKGLLGMLFDRRVPHWTLAFVLTWWTLYEVVGEFSEVERWPPYPALALLTLYGGGLATVVVSWFHGRAGPQRMPPLEAWILALVVVTVVGIGTLLLMG